MKEGTILHAIVKVLKETSPLNVDEIYNEILEKNYYKFGAKDPKHVVYVVLNRSTINSNYTDKYEIHFFKRNDGTYEILEMIEEPYLDKFERDEIQIYKEGGSSTFIKKVYKRSKEARRTCIKYYGCKCFICGFDFEKVYGNVGKGYIQVHHLKLISEAKDVYEIDPIKDLIPVCANCHSIIHLFSRPFSPEDVKKMIISNKYLFK